MYDVTLYEYDIFPMNMSVCEHELFPLTVWHKMVKSICFYGVIIICMKIIDNAS